MTSEPRAATTNQAPHGSRVWHNEQAVRILGQRNSDADARFMLHVLQRGMQVLDCGCGPGSITLGLASHVAPGEVRGIDLNPQLIEKANAAAAAQGQGPEGVRPARARVGRPGAFHQRHGYRLARAHRRNRQRGAFETGRIGVGGCLRLPRRPAAASTPVDVRR